jgi:hypothetical protein
VFATLEDYPDGNSKYFLKKTLGALPLSGHLTFWNRPSKQ